MFWLPIWDFLYILAFFHLSEFSFAYFYTRNELSLASCLVSWPYSLSILFSLLEYLLEDAWLPAFKDQWSRLPGWGLVCVGEAVRKYAMVTAKSSFTHRIQTEEHPTQQLVTCGPYRYLRHPGYLGWFIWAIGTQVVLRNPVCIIGFGITTWRFFKHRIAVEEVHLQRQFGEEYSEYARGVPTYIPFIP